MRVIITVFLVVLSYSTVKAQKTEREYSDYYRQYESSASDIVDGLDNLNQAGYVFVKALKGADLKKVKAAVLNLPVAAVKQMNIIGQYYCSVKHEDCFKLWNLYYKPISRESFDSYCVVLVFMMQMDKVLITN